MNSSHHNKGDTVRVVWLTLATIVVGLTAISYQSFRMDEGGTKFRAMTPTLDGWWTMM